MIEVACRAEWDLAFNLLGAEAVGTMDFACAETKVDFVLGGTNSIAMIFDILVEAKLCVSVRLELVERDTNNADWARQSGEELAREASDVVVGIKSFFIDKLAMIIAVRKIVSPDIDAACVELFAAEAVADIFGQMNEARFGF